MVVNGSTMRWTYSSDEVACRRWVREGIGRGYWVGRGGGGPSRREERSFGAKYIANKGRMR